MYQDILYCTNNKWQHENKHKLAVVVWVIYLI